MTEHVSPLLSEPEAIQWLRLDQAGVGHPEASLKRLRDRGAIRTVRLGRRVFYPVQELQRFVDSEIERGER